MNHETVLMFNLTLEGGDVVQVELDRLHVPRDLPRKHDVVAFDGEHPKLEHAAELFEDRRDFQVVHVEHNYAKHYTVVNIEAYEITVEKPNE